MDFTAWPPLLVVDVEGNGASPPDLVEVAALPVHGGRPDTSAAGAWLSRPNRPVTPYAARMHGLTNQVLATAPDWEDIADEMHALLRRTCVRHPHSAIAPPSTPTRPLSSSSPWRTTTRAGTTSSPPP
ncbi:exonuclease domain-containing protein [Streptomyces sp. NPDC006385]|uniref:3'-5' exonuclease n=1 Tax=Streptomyces sp. NPDC006385 TaxID=3156761 RepID=UPI0033AD4626